MDYLQYGSVDLQDGQYLEVLNIIINGLPSILK